MKNIRKMLHDIRRAERSFISQQLANFELNCSHLPFLLTMLHHDGITQEELSNLVNLDKTTTARLIKPLLQYKYITRKPDPNDKRCYRLQVTKKGYDIAPALKKIIHKWLKILLKGIAKEEQKIAVKVLKQMAVNAKKEMESPLCAKKWR